MIRRQKSFRQRAPRLPVVILLFRPVLLIAFSIVVQHQSSITISAQVDEPTDDEVLRVTTDLLLFPVRIKDRRGQPARGLTERDLFLQDEDRVTSGVYFLAGADRVAFVFALDRSGSLREIISQQRDAALGLFQRFSDKSTIAVLHFDETPVITAVFARDPATARAAFTFSARANQRTAIFDAAAKAINMLDALPPVRSERRIIILISDGLDNASKTKADKVIELARNKCISFYVIHLPLFEPRDGRLDVRRPAKGFRDLAEKTGGKYFLASESAFSAGKEINLTPIFQAIEEDLKSQYLIGFYLNEKANDGRRHNFSLSLPQGLECQVGSRDYSRTLKFFVDRPREALKNRN
jgi:Ca-activated chloride channel family protein